MTPEQKMKAIVEKAGECWHIWYGNSHCSICGVLAEPTTFRANPSPTDLNELFRLAEKLKIEFTICFSDYVSMDAVWDVEVLAPDIKTGSDTPAEALLNALYQAVTEQTS